MEAGVATNSPKAAVPAALIARISPAASAGASRTAAVASQALRMGGD